MHATQLISAFAALALAAPRPQAIDIDSVKELPEPQLDTAPSNATSETVPVVPVSSIVQLADASVTGVAQAKVKRGYLKNKNGSCAKQSAGTGPRVSRPDDSADSFLEWQPFKDHAAAAARPENIPQGYSLAFSDLERSSQTVSYLGFKNIHKYDPIACANYCDQLDGCSAFNLYYERDPSKNPDSRECSNPRSVTNIKCVRWGVKINETTATNAGETRGSFKVVISGSNGYNKDTAPRPQTGFSGPVALGGAINAPHDPVTNTNTYMGHKFFTFDQVGTFANGVTACTTACVAQTEHNARHPPAAPAKPSICNQAVVYVLSQNNQPRGVYCALYTEQWAAAHGTNYGQHKDGDYWGVSQVYGYTNTTYAATYDPICALAGCPSGSYQGGNCGGYGGTCS